MNTHKLLTIGLLYNSLLSLAANPPVERWRGGTKKTFSTIQTAIDSSRAGDVIRIHQGVYYENLVIDGRSGTSSTPIRLEGYPGETVVIDGADKGLQQPNNTRWQNIGNGEYQAIVPFIGNQTWIRITPVATGAQDSLLATYWKETKFDSLQRGSGIIRTGTTVKIRLRGNVSPASKMLHIGLADGIIKVQNASYWEFRNLTLKHAGFSGIYLAGMNVNSITIDQVKVFSAFRGISTEESGNAKNIMVQNCRFSNLIPRNWPWQGYDDGSSAGDDSKAPQRSAGVMIKGTTNAIVKNCEIDGWWDGMKLTGIANRAHHNLIHNIQDDMVELESKYTDDLRFYNNFGYDLNVGISMINNVGGNIYVFRNRIVNTRIVYKLNDPAKYYGYSVKLGPGWGDGAEAKNVKIFNNTFYSCRANIWDARKVAFQYFEFVNNIFYTDSPYYNANFVDNVTSTHTFNNGCYWANNLWNKQPSLQESGIRHGEAGFVAVQYTNAAVNLNLNLLPTSQAKEAGTSYPQSRWPGVDATPIVGKIDIGAHELGGNDYESTKVGPIFGANLPAFKDVNPTSIAEEKVYDPSSSAIVLSPNPVVDIMHIQLPTTIDGNTPLQVRDMNGAIVAATAANDTPVASLDLTILPKGMYVLEVGKYRAAFVKE